MRNRSWMSVGISLLLLFPAVGSLWAADHEQATVAAASEVAKALTAVPLKCIPPTLMHQAKGVAIIPHVVKAGFVVDRRFGRGVILVRRPDGSWSDPIFVTLSGGGVGLEAGVESTDLVLVFRTEGSLDHILKGKGALTLGADVAVAAGPLGREAEAATDRLLKAEVFSYSRSRGLFAGLSLEGDRVQVDAGANEAFYHIQGGHPVEVVERHGAPIAAAEQLKGHLTIMEAPPAPPRHFLAPSVSPR